ncbi:MAG: hypothetical protein JWO03_385 [Bacteroidetes bacterium]|nr:hypothetical protein [Bacteroidota bacterium]
MEQLPPFDKLWDYSDPAATEQKFREIMDTNDTRTDMSYHLQLLTQIARTYSLRRLFTESQNILDEIKPALDEKNGLEHLRFHLEQGRIYNSSGDKESARKEFEKALAMSDEVGHDFHTVDTMHMLAIVSKPNEAIEWNKKAMQKAESSSQERAKNWLGSLYNNLGWDYFAKKDFKTALDILKKGWDWQVAMGREAQAAIAKWAVARTLRAMGKVDEALKMQRELEAENKGKDGFVFEEIAECLYELKKKEEAKPYFAKAYETLKDDPYTETERLKRMQELSK